MAEKQNVTISKRLVAINSASSLLAKLINMTVLLWVYQYLLKRIPAEEFAVLPVVMALMVFAPLFFSFFIGGISRYVVEAYAKGDFDRVTGLVSSILPPLAIAAVVFLAAGSVFALNIEKVLNIAPQMVGDARIMMLMLVVSFSLQMLALPFGTGFHVRQRFVELNLIGVARDVLRMILLFVLLLGIGPQVIWVVTATAISEIAHTVATTLRSRMMVPELRFKRALYQRDQARELMSFGIWTTLGRLGSIMYTNAATIVLNLYGSAVDVTSYHIGSTFFRQIDSTVNLAAQPLQPVLTAMHATEDRVRFGNTIFRAGRYAMWLVLAVATPLTIYSANFIALYLGDDYAITSVVIVFFMIIFPFTQPNVALAMGAMATARVKEFFLPAFLFQLAGLILMIVFVKYTDAGVLGVTASLTIVTVISQLLYYWPLCLKLTGHGFKHFMTNLLIPGIAPAIGGGVVLVSLNIFTPPSTWTSLMVCSLIGGLVYLLVLFAACLNEGEKADIRAMLAKFK